MSELLCYSHWVSNRRGSGGTTLRVSLHCGSAAQKNLHQLLWILQWIFPRSKICDKSKTCTIWCGFFCTDFFPRIRSATLTGERALKNANSMSLGSMKSCVINTKGSNLSNSVRLRPLYRQRFRLEPPSVFCQNNGKINAALFFPLKRQTTQWKHDGPYCSQWGLLLNGSGFNFSIH